MPMLLLVRTTPPSSVLDTDVAPIELEEETRVEPTPRGNAVARPPRNNAAGKPKSASSYTGTASSGAASPPPPLPDAAADAVATDEGRGGAAQPRDAGGGEPSAPGSIGSVDASGPVRDVR